MRLLSEQTLYEILEVPPDAPPCDIEAAYERVRALYAPGSLATYSLMSDEEAALLARRMEEAKATLLDAGARARYDELLAREPEVRPSAATNGAMGATTPVPPVIPAMTQASTSDAVARLPESQGGGEREAVAPATLLGAAALSAGPPPDPASRPLIRLDREISTPTPASAPAPQPAEPPRPDVSEWTGDALRAAREARGITIPQVAERTKVTRHHIENIEAERFGALPAPVYLRGILLSLSRELRLDGQKVARSYLERAAASAAQAAPAPQKPR